MKYRDYAVLTFLTFLIELSISSIVYQITLTQASYAAFSGLGTTWSNAVRGSDLDIVFGGTLVALVFFCVKAYQEHKRSDSGSGK